MRLILGSQSPRRKEILSHFSLPFEQATSSFNEEAVPFKGDPIKHVYELSKGKADSLRHRFHKALILTADTIVYREGKIYGKPKDEQEAFQTLLELSGRWHCVFTGLTLREENREYQQFEETRVLFNPLTHQQIRQYQAKLHWADKAGGYAIQMPGGLIVQKIEGCYYNVMGLPINRVRELLLKVGIELWNYLK
jgi:septum formation protein